MVQKYGSNISICQDCNNKKFANNKTLLRHIRSIHKCVKHDCNQCDYQATRQSHLTIHIQSEHKGVKYACNQCDYQATTQSNLTAHINRKHL